MAEVKKEATKETKEEKKQDRKPLFYTIPKITGTFKHQKVTVREFEGMKV
jgi:hypothetical protein